MQFLPAEIIKKKRNGHELSADEIRYVVRSFTSGELPDYQMSAWLMSVFFKGMTKSETAVLTEAMLHSGRTLDFSNVPGVAVDKHSTGGIGDKTSMIIAPIAAACGVHVPMIAGRGLGHTGGTLDKLEAIPGFRIGLSLDEFKKQVETLGFAIIGQTSEICPADKKIYALRDVTATVESLPLICASIMSKKLAEGIGSLVLDVKHGSGAFMKSVTQAEELADKLMEIGTAHGKRVAYLLTEMNQPLGRFIGNALEMSECFAIMKNEPFRGFAVDKFADTRELSLELAALMIWLGGGAKDQAEGYRKATDALLSGKAWEMFEKMCIAQGGDLKELPVAKNEHVVTSLESGFVAGFEGEKLGLAAIQLGAGRMKTTDPIDATAGIEVHAKIGDAIAKGDPLFTLHANKTNDFRMSETMVRQATTISLQKPGVPALITKRRVNQL